MHTAQNYRLIPSNFNLHSILHFYNSLCCSVYMEQTTHYLVNVIHRKDHHILLNTDLREHRGATGQHFDMELHINFLVAQVSW